MTIRTISFDGDDTLWHHENFFADSRKQFHIILNELGDFPQAAQIADQTHIKNVPLWGYGVRSWTLSMIEAAIALTNGTISGTYIQRLLDLGLELYQHPIILLDHVAQTIQDLQGRYQLLLITKGDLLAQQLKIAQSNLGPFFDGIEIVSEKDPETYAKIFDRYHTSAEETLMIGNSLKSDALPVLELGGQAIHIPYEVTWQFEMAAIDDHHHDRFLTLPSMKDVCTLVDQMKECGVQHLADLKIPENIS